MEQEQMQLQTVTQETKTFSKLKKHDSRKKITQEKGLENKITLTSQKTELRNGKSEK